MSEARELEYPIMEPPFVVKPFDQMSESEARAHLEWYISELPHRIDVLRSAFAITSGQSRGVLDFSPQSLSAVWQWFKTQIRQETKTQDEIDAERGQFPEQMRQHIDVSARKLSQGTLIIAMDIAAYFAEVLVRNQPTVKWSVITQPPAFADVNQPVLTGFQSQTTLNPRRVVRNLTLRAVDPGRGDDSLEDMYDRWVGYIQK